jgi:predicted nucleic acid-binding protein
MILVDTGPIVALILENDPYHGQVEKAFTNVQGPMITTDACVTEALHFLHRSEGWQGQEKLWHMIVTGFLVVRAQDENAPIQAFPYMDRFRDQPCDYADASLLVAAEDTGQLRILTLDKHFHAYRLLDGRALEVIP